MSDKERIETLRIDLRRTEARYAEADLKGDLAARSIAWSRIVRVREELEIALGVQRPSMSTAPSTAPKY